MGRVYSENIDDSVFMKMCLIYTMSNYTLQREYTTHHPVVKCKLSEITRDINPLNTKDTKAFKIGFPRFLFVFVVSTSFSNGAKHCIYGKQCPKYEVMF